jgi:hypothetical protein
MTDTGHKPGRAILYLRASAGELDETRDSTAIGETHRGVLFIREKMPVSSASHLIDTGVATEIGGLRKPVAAEGERGREGNDRQGNRGGRGARG